MTRTIGRIFHLVTAADPTAARATPLLATDQFERHGFVHCCFREQLIEIANWWFEPAADLVSLELDPSLLTAELRIEASPSRWYPHVYGPVDNDAVVAAHPMPAASNRPLPPALAESPPGFQLTAGGASRATVRWRADGHLDGDAAWIARALAAVDAGLTVELIGGIVVPATLDRPYESFATLESVAAGGIIRYDGDGFY